MTKVRDPKSISCKGSGARGPVSIAPFPSHSYPGGIWNPVARTSCPPAIHPQDWSGSTDHHMFQSPLTYRNYPVISVLRMSLSKIAFKWQSFRSSLSKPKAQEEIDGYNTEPSDANGWFWLPHLPAQAASPGRAAEHILVGASPHTRLGGSTPHLRWACYCHISLSNALGTYLTPYVFATPTELFT